MIPFTQADFNQLCYLPYNTIFVALLAHQGNIKHMRVEQDAEVAHRKAKLSAHPELNRDEWSGYQKWLDSAERTLIDEIEKALDNGMVTVPRTMDEAEAFAQWLCRTQVPWFGTWQALPREPVWVPHPEGGHVIDIRPAGTR